MKILRISAKCSDLFDARLVEPMKFQVQEIGKPTNVSMVGTQENCAEYCAKSNQIMIDYAEPTRFEVVLQVVVSV